MTKQAFTCLLVVAFGCSNDDSKPTAGELHERDTTAVVTRPIDGASGMSLVFTRTRDDGWRRVDLRVGDKTYAFHADASRYMLDANGQGFGARAVVCGMTTPDVHDGMNMAIRCAIATPTGLGVVHDIATPTSAWLGDVCIDGDDVTLLYSSGSRPIDPEAPLDAAPCLAEHWNPSQGWDTSPAPSSTCACDLRDGAACTDPCFIGTGKRADGICDTTGLARACDDGDPATDDFCTGTVEDLCYSVPRV